jgi:hypothetical protein
MRNLERNVINKIYEFDKYYRWFHLICFNFHFSDQDDM